MATQNALNNHSGTFSIGTASYPGTIAKGDVLVASADNVIGVQAGAATAGYVLMANGANTAPTFQANVPGGAIGTIAGDSGSATGPTVTIAGGTNITTVAATATCTVNLDAALTGLSSITVANGGELRTGITAADTLLFRAYNVNGTAYTTFATLTAHATTPTMNLDTEVTINSAYIYRGGGTDVSVADGGTGASTLTDHGVLIGNATNAVTATAEGATGTVLIGTTASPPSWSASPTVTTMNATTFDTNVAAAKLQIAGTTITATGSDAAVGMTITTKGAGDVTVTTGDVILSSGNLSLPTTSSTVGQVLINSVPMLHSFDDDTNVFICGAGNFTMNGSHDNIGIGDGAGLSLSTGYGNIFLGENAGGAVTTTYDNIAIGKNALAAYATSYSGAIAIGSGALALYTGTHPAIAIGNSALTALTSGDYSTAIGFEAGKAVTTGDGNIFIGYQSGASVTEGSNNIGIGSSTCKSTTGGSNICIGYHAGYNLTTTDNGNVLIDSSGVSGDVEYIRIGKDQTKCFIKGIYGVAIGTEAVYSASTGQLGKTSSSIKHKENVHDIGDKSEILYKLRPVRFTWKQDPDLPEFYGLIAEETAEVFPEITSWDKETGEPNSVYYEKLPALLLNELQKQNKRIAALEAALAAKGV